MALPPPKAPETNQSEIPPKSNLRPVSLVELLTEPWLRLPRRSRQDLRVATLEGVQPA